MKHFQNIQSFDDLKTQYRNLAKANHPDMGGDIVAMQEINAEYEILFPIYKNKFVKKSGEECNETAHSTMSEFYTQNGWKGTNYDSNLSTTEISKRIRLFVKEAFPTYKFSITTEYYSMGSSIHITLMEATEDVFVNPEAEKYTQLNTFYLDKENGITELGREVMKMVDSFICSYRYSDTDAMIDYFDTNFYYNLHIGKWDRPFKVVPKTARIKSAESGVDKQPADNQPGTLIPENLNIEIIDYSEKAIAVFGDTKPIKDKLHELGGSFNKYLNYRGEKKPGWIFSKKKEVELKRELNLVG